ncbi:MAG: U32 family peptidase [Firmicutes bacterium]|nr:U32 family peptidase [Bacillota bacterium]
MAVKKEKRKIPELLAPAGTKEAFIAAVESGADAIYLGGKILNARMGAGNFSLQEMKEAIDFAHKRHVKVYVTVNTLVGDEEMEEALEYCKELYGIGADALIIQDFGIGHLVKEYIPEMTIHLSTQGSIYDVAGAEAAKDLGYERVVLAREVSLKDIRMVCAEADIEVEVFCHGAICICYSGQCQMSRSIGARSGNRGACAQPCRLEYEIKSEGKKKGKGYYLSPSDMNLIDYLGELADAGVASIKIEGRMKSPEYVSVVTSIYRKYLDEYRDNGTYSVSDEDRFSLAQIFNRGFTTAYIDGADIGFMSGDKPKHRGVYAGKVTLCEKIKGKNDRYIVEALLDIPIEKNDVLEIGSDAHSTVTLLEGKYPKVRMGDVIGQISVGDPIYRMVSGKQIASAGLSYKNKDWHEGKFVRRNKLTCDVISDKEGYIKCILRDESGASVEVSDGPFNRADDDSAAARIRESLSKMGGTPFEVSNVRIRGNIPYKVPVSKINEMRRTAVKRMEEALCNCARKEVMFSARNLLDASDALNANNVPRESGHARNDFWIAAHNAKSTNDINVNEGENVACEGVAELFYYDIESFLNDKSLARGVKKLHDRGVELFALLPAAQLIEKENEAKEKANSIHAKIIPYIGNITKGKENEIIENEFDAVCKLAARSGIYIGNINWIKKFFGAGIKVYGDYGINKYNRWTEEAMKKLGAEYATDSLENFDVGSGIYGSVPLMTSEHSFSGDALIDRKGAEYKIVKRTYSSQDIIALESGMSISECILTQLKDASEKRMRMRVYI